MFDLKDLIHCCCNNINNNLNMDIESYRNRKVKFFVESIGITYCSTWKNFTNDMGLQVTEELKLVTESEWDELFMDLKVSKIQRRKFNIAMDNLHATGPPDPTINKPLPLKTDSASKSSATSDAKPPPSNKRKAGNTNIKNYYKVQKPKQVIDMTAKDAEKNE